MNNGSPSGKLNTADVKDLAQTSIMVGVAAALTYFGQHLAGLDLGTNSALVSAVLTVVIDSLVKLVKDNTKE